MLTAPRGMKCGLTGLPAVPGFCKLSLAGRSQLFFWSVAELSLSPGYTDKSSLSGGLWGPLSPISCFRWLFFIFCPKDFLQFLSATICYLWPTKTSRQKDVFSWRGKFTEWLPQTKNRANEKKTTFGWETENANCKFNCFYFFCHS